MSKSILNLRSDNNFQTPAFQQILSTDWALVGTTTKDNGDTETRYRMIVDNPQYGCEARIGFYPKPNANDGYGQENRSVRITTYQLDDTDVDDVRYDPLEIVIALRTPGRGLPPAADVVTALDNARNFIVRYANGALVEDYFDRLANGVTDVLG